MLGIRLFRGRSSARAQIVRRTGGTSSVVKHKFRLQDEWEWYKDLRANDPTGWVNFIKMYAKASPAQGARKARAGFSVAQGKHALNVQSGTRSATRCKMMWEQYYYSFAKSVAGGYLTKEQAEFKWKAMKAYPLVKRDESGPNGFWRLAISVAKYIDLYNDVNRLDSIEQFTSEKKKATDADIESLKQATFSGSSHSASLDLTDMATRFAMAESMVSSAEAGNKPLVETGAIFAPKIKYLKPKSLTKQRRMMTMLSNRQVQTQTNHHLLWRLAQQRSLGGLIAIEKSRKQNGFSRGAP